MMRKTGQITLVICVIFWIGCGAKSKPPVLEESTPTSAVEAVAEETHRTHEDIQAQMTLLFPEDGAITNWQKSGETTLFDEITLFEHINGAAEAFFAYDFQLCGTAEYIPRGADVSLVDEFIQVDIYDMGSDIHAFGIYTGEIYPDLQAVDIGAQGYVEIPALNFWKGPYYVKISGSTEAESVAKANMQLAKYIAQRIPGGTEKPAMLSLLPTEGLMPGTEAFVFSDILGYRFLKNGLTATYQMGGEEKTLVMAEYITENDAKDALVQFEEYEQKSGEGFVSTSDLGEGFIVNDKYYKRLMVVHQGRHLVLVVGVTDDAVAKELIKKAIANISD